MAEKKLTAKNKGRPSKYEEEYNEQVKKLCMLGAIDTEIADFFGVAPSTYYEWQEKHPKFRESIKEGKLVADMKVSEALFKRATGYELKAFKFATADGKITDKVEYMQAYAPDPTAAIFWLKNRQRDKWSDKQEIDHSGNVGITIVDDIPESN